jgi:hypothetical protein
VHFCRPSSSVFRPVSTEMNILLRRPRPKPGASHLRVSTEAASKLKALPVHDIWREEGEYSELINQLDRSSVYPTLLQKFFITKPASLRATNDFSSIFSRIGDRIFTPPFFVFSVPRCLCGLTQNPFPCGSSLQWFANCCSVRSVSSRSSPQKSEIKNGGTPCLSVFTTLSNRPKDTS